MSPTALTVTAPASSGYPASPESPERRRCWECLRRRLVCDAIKPVCNKCRTAGIVCPGYDDKKPLTWLAPGKVTCRTRRKPRSGETDADSKKPMKPKPKTLRKGLGRVLSEEEQRIFDGVEYILHSDLRTDICDVYEAVQYCELIYHVGINPTGLGSRGVVLNAKKHQAYSLPTRQRRLLPLHQGWAFGQRQLVHRPNTSEGGQIPADVYSTQPGGYCVSTPAARADGMEIRLPLGQTRPGSTTPPSRHFYPRSQRGYCQCQDAEQRHGTDRRHFAYAV